VDLEHREAAGHRSEVGLSGIARNVHERSREPFLVPIGLDHMGSRIGDVDEPAAANFAPSAKCHLGWPAR